MLASVSMTLATVDTSLSDRAAVLIVRKHHRLVRLSHWLNLPILFMLIVSGLAIYWASPVFLHAPNRVTGSRDYLADAGAVVAGRLPGDVPANQLRYWVYRHFSVGVYALAPALRLHWLFAYLFMGCGLLYLAGLASGGGYRSLIPRRSDPREAVAMLRYYLGLVPMRLSRRPWPHPSIRGKYNALQRAAYLSMPLFGVLAVASGWAMHKPAQLGWLERLFGSYDGARIIHFVTMWVFIGFLVPHVVLVIGDGWDTMRSMIVGWSKRTGGPHE
jgi:thiosulfate reductase cytochrome b subunit